MSWMNATSRVIAIYIIRKHMSFSRDDAGKTGYL